MLREVLRCPAARSALGYAGLLNVVATATALVLLPLSEGSWHAGDAAFGIATACLGFGALGAPLLTRLPSPLRGVTVARGLLVIAAAVALVAATPVPWPALPMLALAGAVGVVVESLLTGTLQDAVPDRYRAGALGLADTVMVGACLVGSLVAPALAQYAGARLALVLVALVAVLPVLVVWLVPTRRPTTPYDAAREPAGKGSDPRSTPAVGAARLG
jgi:MFS family permease